MFDRFTVLAMYCVYFTKTQQEYAHMLSNLSTYYNIENALGHAQEALKYMKPVWERKPKDTIVRKKNTKLINELKREIAVAINAYTNADWDGGQITKELYEERLKKLHIRLCAAEGNIK